MTEGQTELSKRLVERLNRAVSEDDWSSLEDDDLRSAADEIDRLTALTQPSGELALETTEEIRAELARLFKTARQGPWWSDSERNSGIYGSGEDTHEGFDSYYIKDAHNRTVVDTFNSDATVEVEYDEDGTHAWDEAGRQSVELIVLLRNEGERLLRDFALVSAENTRLTAALAEEKAGKDRLRELNNAAMAMTEAAEARLAGVEKALKPFASRAENYSGAYQDSDLAENNSITVGDLRTARAALTPTEKPK